MTFLKAFVLAVLFAIPMLWAEARMRAPIPLTSQQFAGAPAGQPVKLIVRVDALGPQRLRGETSPGRVTVRRLVVVTKYVSVSHPKA